MLHQPFVLIALMFIHFGIMAERSTEVCLQKIPNSHNDTKEKYTITIQGHSPLRSFNLIVHLLELA